MALLGKSIDKLIEAAPGRKFSPGSAIGISIQMVNAFRALHNIGYLHRDIKPANAAMGRQEDNELRVLYVLDFGMARKFTRDDVSQLDFFEFWFGLLIFPSFFPHRELYDVPAWQQTSEDHHGMLQSRRTLDGNTRGRTTSNPGST
jgi:serine/threonine protein kinase